MQLPRSALWLFTALLILPWFVVLYLARHEHPGADARDGANASRSPARGTTVPVSNVKPGPWGELSFRRVLIEPPESLINAPSATPPPPIWHFRGYTPDQLDAWWRDQQIEPAQVALITDRARWEIADDLIKIRPPEPFISSLTPTARAQIYTRLADFAENKDQAHPFRVRAEVADEWFRDSDLRPETLALVQRYLYRRGTSLIFSDFSTVAAKIPTNAERVRLLKTLARKSTLLVQLHLKPDSDLDAIDRYWSRGQRTRDIMPLLRSLASKGETTTIDIIHLLPRLPRSLLYTYPVRNQRGVVTFLDCHWTTLNFFNFQPDPRFENIEAVQDAFVNEHHVLTTKPTFGDVVMLTRNETVLHTCVYIADDIVFTKNGASPDSPWILMELSDVIAFYPSDEPLDVQYYRSRRVATED